MKRPFGLIGLTYLSVLTVVYYVQLPFVSAALALIAAAVLLTGVIRCIRKRKSRRVFALIAASATALAALLSSFLYQKAYLDPIENDFSDREISVEGYICDEITTARRTAVYPVMTQRIDGKPVRLQMLLYLREDYELQEFDCVTFRAHVFSAGARLVSRQILFTGFESNISQLSATGQTHVTPYAPVVSLRKAAKRTLDSLLSHDSAALCKAILFGDKQGMDDSTRRDFQNTGTTFLIVVSGMHLSIVERLLRRLFIRHLRYKRLLGWLGIPAVLLFTALSGFSPAVCRAAVAAVMSYAALLLFGNADSINSLGIAALVLTVGNPCAVGNIGLLLSFSATLGILLWCSKTEEVMQRGLRLKRILSLRLYALLRFFVGLFAASLSASLWVLPVAILSMHRITPWVVIVSLLTEPIACLLLVLAIALMLLMPLPDFAVGVAWIAEVCSRLMLGINARFADMPFAKIQADQPFWAFWLTVVAALVAGGYLMRRRRLYVRISVLSATALLLACCAVTEMTADRRTEVTVFQNGKGVSVAVSKDASLSLLSCGGTPYFGDQMLDTLCSRSRTAEHVILPNRQRYVNLLAPLCSELSVKNLYCDRDYEGALSVADAGEEHLLSGDTDYTLRLNSDTQVTIIHAGKSDFEYLQSGDTTLLFVPMNSSVRFLPKQYRRAQYLVLDGVPRHMELLQGDTAVYTGYQNDRFENNRDRLQSICREVIPLYKNTYSFRCKS